MSRRVISLALCLMALASAGRAAEPPVRLTDEALGAQRGGLRTPLGYEVGFGANVRTYVDGNLALETRLTWTEAGPLVAGGAVDPAVWTIVPGEVLGGETRLRHEITGDRIVSIVLNTASERTVRQQTDVVLYAPQLAELQAETLSGRMADALSQALNGALAEAAR